MHQDKMNQLLKNNSIITTSDFSRLKIPRTYLARLVNKSKLHKVARGIYIRDWSEYDDYAILQLQNEKVRFSYLSALYLNGLTDIIPKYLEITVYNGYNAHQIPSGVQVHYIKKELFDLGCTSQITPLGNQVLCYNMERTICDLIKNRSKIDVELFATTIRKYVKSKDKNLMQLHTYALKMGINDKVHEIMEIAYE